MCLSSDDLLELRFCFCFLQHQHLHVHRCISWVFAKWISPLQSVCSSEWVSCVESENYLRNCFASTLIRFVYTIERYYTVRDAATVVRFAMAVRVVGSKCLVSKSYFFAVNLFFFSRKLFYQGIYFSTLFHLRVYDGYDIFLGFLLCFCCFFSFVNPEQFNKNSKHI